MNRVCFPIFERYIGIDSSGAFQKHWPTGEDNTYVDFIRDGLCGDGAARTGSPRWRRLTDVRAGAKSVFHFDVPGSTRPSSALKAYPLAGVGDSTRAALLPGPGERLFGAVQLKVKVPFTRGMIRMKIR